MGPPATTSASMLSMSHSSRLSSSKTHCVEVTLPPPLGHPEHRSTQQTPTSDLAWPPDRPVEPDGTTSALPCPTALRMLGTKCHRQAQQSVVIAAQRRRYPRGY
jgi:hypothetical protein